MNNKLFGWRTPESYANEYIENIEQILQNEENILNFRNNMGFGYSRILEHLTENDGQRYYDDIKKNHFDDLSLLEKTCKNDSIGNPIKYQYGNLLINPTTMRYSKVCFDIKNTFGDLKDFNYVEIGAGYGGLVRSLSSIYDFNTIKLFDLHQPLKLQSLYLSKFGIRSESKTIEEDFEILENSILVSNYAWCELNEEYRQIYMQKIINKCKFVYMTVYDINIEKDFKNVFGEVKYEIDFFNGCTIIKIKR